jgi:hypothetical protein
MKYTVEMTSDGMKYIPSFITIGSGIRVMLYCAYYLNNVRGYIYCWY